MPEDKMTAAELEMYVLKLEQLDLHCLRCKDYEVVQKLLENGEIHIDVSIIERLLAICEHDLREEMKLTPNTLKVISAILKRIKDSQYTALPNLVPSAMAIIQIIKTAALMSKVDTLKALCFDTLLSYPNATLITVVSTHCIEVVEIFNLYGHPRIPIENRIQTCNLIHKLLKILPSDTRSEFVKEGLSAWFSKIIPTVMMHLSDPKQENIKPLLTLEMLTEDLVPIHYADHPQWVVNLECICNTKKYPAIMKNLLEKGSKIWHRLWIIFIKLLKNQITRCGSEIGSPINSMLLIVETAFKMDKTNRCRAFACWNVLIDNFCTETNENYLTKRLKLLIVPLKSNNAKVEEIALAKFNTWWHLIIKFENKMDKYNGFILVPFLQFCFGKPIEQEQNAFVPGKLSEILKKNCRQALIEICGHDPNCDKCPSLPGVNGRKFNTNTFDQFVYMAHSFVTAIQLSGSNKDDEETAHQIECLCKSFLNLVGDLPITDQKTEAVSIILQGFEKILSLGQLSDIFLNIIIQTLFDENQLYKLVFALNCDSCSKPLHDLVIIIVKQKLSSFFGRSNVQDLLSKCKPITNAIVMESLNSRDLIDSILKDMPSNVNSFAMWTALAESMLELECKDDLPYSICDTLMWPLKHMNQYSDIQVSAMAWYRLYAKYPNSKDADENILKHIHSSDVTETNKDLKLYAIMSILRLGLIGETSFKHAKEVELLENLIKKIDDFEHNVQVFPILIDTLVIMMESATNSINYTLAQHTISSVKHVLKLMPRVLAKDSELSHQILIGNLLKSMDVLLRIESYSHLIPIISDDLAEYSSSFSKHATLKKIIVSIMTTCSINNHVLSAESKSVDIVDADRGNGSSKETAPPVLEPVHQNSIKNNFPTPNTKVVPKKSKKREASIVNTVVENGEEYVVVKSNWKFNPRKLTENQKEKMQRKREDIPALYQDLSQSQDELRLSSWRTDSQDVSSSTNSKSNIPAHNESSSILKHFPSSNIVPKIMENLMTEKDKLEKKDNLPVTPKIGPNDNVNKVKQSASPLSSKSPRMALKDRVFRNVRNLIENSTMPKDTNTSSENPIQNGNESKTPTSHLRNNNQVINSAPPLISADRPSRVKRKPRKFDDVEIFAMKKGRRSLSQSDLQVNASDSNTTDDIAKEKNVSENDNTDNAMIDNLGVTKENNEAVSITTENAMIDNLGVTEQNNEAVSCVVEPAIEVPAESQMDVTFDKDKETSPKDKEDTLQLYPNLPNAQISDPKEFKEGESFQKTLLDNKESSTPTQSKLNKLNCGKSSTKKSSVRKSRIEKELAIDMVEGHPFLKIQSEKRVTRKKLMNSETGSRRKSLSDKFNKAMPDTNTSEAKMGKTSKVKGFLCPKKDSTTITVTETEELGSTPSTDLSHSEELPFSEDIIESSQDSTVTTISVRSTKKKMPVVSIKKINFQNELSLHKDYATVSSDSLSANLVNKDDIEISRNKTASEEKTVLDSTEDMDTEPIGNKGDSDVILIDDEESPITINTAETNVGPDTQEIAEADTQPIDSVDLLSENVPESMNCIESDIGIIVQNSIVDSCTENVSLNKEKVTIELSTDTEKDIEVPIDTDKDITMTAIELNTESSAIEKDSNSETSSPFKDDAQRKKDFLNNTLEISPIKTMSPNREKKSLSPETSSDYVIIKLSSPVHINGEPFDKGGSPEFFTDDKVSPDKRDQSPPRVELSANSSSPSSSLSLKKNRPQVRSGGRAAQMLGLCVPDRLTIRTDRTESEEPKKSSSSNTPVRRNLKILYNTANDDSDNIIENDQSDNFLSLKRLLPPVDCSPSVPILKRKLAEIVDDATASPASKRKRVSFHDPPVSTTVAVQNYIEPGSLRSPQSVPLKRAERQGRLHINMKSQRRLDSAFKLDSVLTKAVESFIDVDDTQASSLEQTPAVEVVKTSELNDTDPICALLCDCKDPIDKIGSELSSPAMKSLLIKELEGKVETIGDLAKMTELEVNRLCIKAPKVQVAKKVLAEYATNIIKDINIEENIVIDEPTLHEEVIVPETIVNNVEVQTSSLMTNDVGIQVIVSEEQSSTQTEAVPISHTHAQTEESGFKSTTDVITSCLTERHDFVEKLSDQLEDSAIQKLSEKLPVNAVTDILLKKMTASNSTEVFNRVLEQSSEVNGNGNKQLIFLRDYIVDRFDSKDCILLCTQILQKYHGKL